MLKRQRAISLMGRTKLGIKARTVSFKFFYIFKGFLKCESFFKVFIEHVTILLPLFIFWSFGCKACGVLAPWPVMEPVCSCTGRRSSNHWTVREVPGPLHNLKNYWGLPKTFCFCGLYLSMFTILEIKFETFLKV